MKNDWDEKRRREEREHERREEIKRRSGNLIKKEETVQYQEFQKQLELQKLQKLVAKKEEMNKRIAETLHQMQEKSREVSKIVEEQRKLVEEEMRMRTDLAIQIANQQSKQSRVDMAKAAMKEQEDDELDR